MKKVFLGILVVLAVLSVIAWWLKPKPIQDGKTVLTWCSDDNPARRDQIALFNRLHPEYRLQLDPGNNGMEKVIVQSVAGVGPDLFDIYQPGACIEAGIAWDITDALRKAGVDFTNDVWKAVHPYVLQDGRIYGFPRNSGTDAVFYNKAILEQNGIPAPQAKLGSEEFLELARKLTVMEPNGRPKHFGFLFDWWQWQTFVYQWGGHVYSADGTRCIVDGPETIAAVQFMQDLIWKYKVSPSPIQETAMATSGGWGTGSITLFGGGRAAMALGGRWWLCLLRDKRQYPDLRVGAVEVQCGPVRRYWGYGGAVMINGNSPRREQALDFMIYMTGREYNELINHQADAMGPMKKFTETDLFLQDPAFPDEDYNQVWRDVMAHSEPREISEFINGTVADRIVAEQLDLVRNNQKTAAEAMKTAAQQINSQIEKNVRKFKAMKTRYDALRAGKAGST